MRTHRIHCSADTLASQTLYQKLLFPVLQTKDRVAGAERDVGASQEALSSAVAESRQLEGAARSTAGNVEDYAQVRQSAIYQQVSEEYV